MKMIDYLIVLKFNLKHTYLCSVPSEQNDMFRNFNLGSFSTKNHHQSSLIRRLLYKHDTVSHNRKVDVIVLRNWQTNKHLKVHSLDKISNVYRNNSNETYFIVCFLKIHTLNFCFYVLVTRLETSKFCFLIFDSVYLSIFLKKVLLNKHVAQCNFDIQHVSFRYCKSFLRECTLFFGSKCLLNHVYSRLYFVSICLSKYTLRNQLYHPNHIKRHRKFKDKSSDCNFVKQIDLKNVLNQCQLKEERKLYLYLQDERGEKSINQTELEIAKPDSCVSKGSDCNNESNDYASLELSKAVKLSLYSQLWWSRNTTLNLIAYPLHNASRQPSENPSPSTPAQQNPQTRDIHRLMHFEVFRLCSFSYSRFPPNVNLWVTLLAQSGFYVVNDSGRVRCFSCGYEYEDFLIGSPVDNAHGPQCERHTFNRPLHEWIRGLDRDVLESYYLVFGNLRPYVSDDSENLDHLNSSAQAVLHEDPTHPESGFSETEARQAPPGGPSLGSADSQDPQSYQRAADAVVYQESQEPQPREVLTSAAQQPVTLDRSANGASADQTHPDTERGATGYTNFDLSLASYPQFAGTSSRRSTFSGWNPEHPQKPDDLVAGGFFYAGYADCVRCFYCGLGLKYWRPDDIPAYQHARFRPNCVYNRMYKGQEYIDRVQQDNQQDAGNNVERNQTQTANPAPQPTTTQPPNPPPNVAVTTEHAHLRLPASQEASRAGWRSDQIIPAVTHIIDELGIDGQNLSYEILLDVLVQLYSANDAPNLGSDRSEGSVDSNHGGQSSDGVVDSSIPTLRFPQDVSASEKLRTLNDGVEVADSAEPAPVTTAGTATATTTTSRHNDQEQFRAVENEHNYLTQRSLCGICHQRPLHCVFLPCGHVIACQECAEAATKCPICNKNVAATANVYLS